uniref:Uncharacterized protein n=1 Tax=Fervidobacterium thailandense TaxID=1008305 RepID=A0A7C4W1Y8_9BACT
MKKFYLTLVLILAICTTFGLDLSAMLGLELGGKNRPFLGARVGTLEGGLSVALEAYYAMSSFSELGNINPSEVKFLELTPYLYMALPLSTMLLYAGAGPIIFLDLVNFGFAPYSFELLHAKLGLKFGKEVFFFAETMTTFTLSFQTFGIFALTAGAGLSF